MGFLNKKPNTGKVYSLGKALEIINKYPDYIPYETKGGYKLVPEKKDREEVESFKERRKNFMVQISEKNDNDTNYYSTNSSRTMITNDWMR